MEARFQMVAAQGSQIRTVVVQEGGSNAHSSSFHYGRQPLPPTRAHHGADMVISEEKATASINLVLTMTFNCR